MFCFCKYYDYIIIFFSRFAKLSNPIQNQPRLRFVEQKSRDQIRINFLLKEGRIWPRQVVLDGSIDLQPGLANFKRINYHDDTKC